MWMTTQQLEACGDRMCRLVSVRVWCGRRVHYILLSCLIRVPALRSCCVNLIALGALHLLREELAHLFGRVCVEPVSVGGFATEPTCLKGGEQQLTRAWLMDTGRRRRNQRLRELCLHGPEVFQIHEDAYFEGLSIHL